MKRSAIILAATVLIACETKPPCDCDCPPEVQAKVQNRLQQYRAQGAQVAGDDVSRAVKTCKPGDPCVIEVKVTEKEDGTCYAPLEYCLICLRKGNPPSSTPLTVTWQLKVDPKAKYDYEFVAKRGIRIPYAGITGKDDFIGHGYGQGGNSKEYRWIAGPGRSDVLPHVAEVKRKGAGPSDPICLPIDPVIVNTN